MDFTHLNEYLSSLSTDLVPGMDLCVYREHEPIYRRFLGYRDRERGIPMDGTEKYWIFSATKVFTAAAGMQCVERGLFRLDDPVSKYLPAYKLVTVNDNGHIRLPRDPLTIRHLFTMTGGFNYAIDCPSLMKAKLYSRNQADTLTVITALAEEPLDFYPGTRYQYSLCHDVLAAVIETVSGLKYSEYLKRNIFGPLGIQHTGFFPDDLSGFAQQYVWDDKQQKCIVKPEGNLCDYRITERYESGGAGLYSTVDDYILLADALACGGMGKSGQRILQPETVHLMATPQLSEEIRRRDFINHFGPSYTYGLGVRVNCEEGSSSPIGEFGWDGAASAYTLSDPVNRVSCFLGMHVRSFGYGYDVLHHQVKDLLYEGLNA